MATQQNVTQEPEKGTAARQATQRNESAMRPPVDVFEMTDRMEALYADVRSMLYRCSFVLSSELDTSQIEAILKDGVLAVRIPKRAAFRPRRIEVQSG